MNIISIRILVGLCWIYAMTTIDYSADQKPAIKAESISIPSTDNPLKHVIPMEI